MGFIICPCGEKVKNWLIGIYQIIHNNNKGKIIYAVCYHGKIIINKKEK